MKFLCRFCNRSNDTECKTSLIYKPSHNIYKDIKYFYAGNRVQIIKSDTDIEYIAVVVYMEIAPIIDAYPYGGKNEYIYVRFYDENAYNHILSEGSRLMSIHPRGIFEKCVILNITYYKNTIKEILVKNEHLLSPRIPYTITLEKIDCVLICKYKYHIVRI